MSMTLNRWLFRNTITRLERTKTFILIPAFSRAVTWLGYSDIVGIYEYESPNNFSFRDITDSLPTNPNYVLCVSYVNDDGDVVRYKLWEDVGEIFWFPCDLYEDQFIGKTFRIEIWSINSNPAVQATDISLLTSVLGNEDIAHGVNAALVSTAGITSIVILPLTGGSGPIDASSTTLSADSTETVDITHT